MADPVVFTDGYFALKDTTATGSPVELSGNKEIRFNVSRAELDDAVSGDEHDAKYPGRKQIQVTVRHRQDFTTDGVDDTIWPKFNSRTKQDFEIRPTGSAVGVDESRSTPSTATSPRIRRSTAATGTRSSRR